MSSTESPSKPRKKTAGKITPQPLAKAVTQDVISEQRVINQSITDRFAAYHGDCVEVCKGIPDNSLDYSIFSPPFASLYVYSASDRDMGNSKDHGEFFAHYQFLLKELFRALKPGRLVSFHCMNLPTSKAHDGFIGIRDFRGELIRAMEKEGFIYHSEVCIWKDPVTAMQRTKAIGLLYKQIRKDSSMSRQGIPDYLVTMRKPGDNPDPVRHYAGEELAKLAEAKWASGEWKKGEIPAKEQGQVFEVAGSPNEPGWQQYASPIYGDNVPADIWRTGLMIVRPQTSVADNYAEPVWMDINPSDTLQYRSAREHNDERHICPLQLEVIRRGIRLWTNPGETVFTPFMGIGSELYVAIQMGRKGIGSELKASYYGQAVRNLKNATADEQFDLFANLEEN